MSDEKEQPEAARNSAAEPDLKRSGDAAPRESAERPEQQQTDAVEQSDDGAEQELARTREAMLRLRAEMDNREKRLEREMARTRKFALEALLRDLVPVMDSIDQALAADDAAGDEHGMALVRRQAVKVLGEHGLEVLDPEGQPFDPSWHEAVATEPRDDVEPDTVARVLQRGYRLNERLIRPARVIVARPA